MTLRELPSVEKLATAPELAGLPHPLAVEVARTVIAEAREALRRGKPVPPLAATAAARAAALAQNQLRPAINATGIILHTNLGRATLAPSAAAAVAAAAAHHVPLEVDAATGGRGDRQEAIAQLLRELTGAEDALVVNNNAAATILAVAALAAGREVILSRGQLVEIGGHFRLPDVITQAGATLVEVGTTNRTRITDYARALTERTALLLRCHPSNFKVVGFTEEASLAELVALGRAHGVTVGDDIGSGALVDFTPFGLTDEPTVTESIATGADLCWFSGDKLLGGPQAGILLGRKDVIQQCKRSPLSRALRPDKLTLAGLEATLRLYRTGRAWEEIPTLRRIARPIAELEASALRLVVAVAALGYRVAVVATQAQVGGGSLPGHRLPSFALALESENTVELGARLRQAPRPVYGRLEKDRLVLDLRTVDPKDEVELLAALDVARKES